MNAAVHSYVKAEVKVQGTNTILDCKLNAAQILLFKKAGTLSACFQGQKGSPLALALLQSQTGGRKKKTSDNRKRSRS